MQIKSYFSSLVKSNSVKHLTSRTYSDPSPMVSVLWYIVSCCLLKSNPIKLEKPLFERQSVDFCPYGRVDENLMRQVKSNMTRTKKLVVTRLGDFW